MIKCVKKSQARYSKAGEVHAQQIGGQSSVRTLWLSSASVGRQRRSELLDSVNKNSLCEAFPSQPLGRADNMRPRRALLEEQP